MLILFNYLKLDNRIIAALSKDNKFPGIII